MEHPAPDNRKSQRLHKVFTARFERYSEFFLFALSMLTNMFEKTPPKNSVLDSKSGGQENRRMRKSFSKGSLHTTQPQHSCFRRYVSQILRSQCFDNVAATIIVGNFIEMIFETNYQSKCYAAPDSDGCDSRNFYIMNLIFLQFFTIEAFANIYVQRLNYLKKCGSMLDIIIVIAGYVDVALDDVLPGPSFSMLRLFRLMRLARALRIVRHIPELFLMIRGFTTTLAAMLWGFAMILILLTIFSILCVEIINPLYRNLDFGDSGPDEFCATAFSNVQTCILLFFQTLMAGDSWGRCTIPVIQAHWWTFGIFSLILILISLGFTNLVLAVIVDTAHSAHDEDIQAQLVNRVHEQRSCAAKLHAVFERIDQDQSGTISYDELLEGYREDEDLRNLLYKLKINEDDLIEIFDLMDAEDTGELQYEFLTKTLQVSTEADLPKTLLMLRLQAAEITRFVKKISTTDSEGAQRRGSRRTSKKKFTLRSAVRKDTYSRATSPAASAHGRITLHSLDREVEGSLSVRPPSLGPLDTSMSAGPREGEQDERGCRRMTGNVSGRMFRDNLGGSVPLTPYPFQATAPSTHYAQFGVGISLSQPSTDLSREARSALNDVERWVESVKPVGEGISTSNPVVANVAGQDTLLVQRIGRSPPEKQYVL